MKYKDIIKILTAHDFTMVRHKGSHRHYEGYVSGKRQMVTVAYRALNEHIKPKNLASMIRQSGLPKSLFH